MRPNHTDHHVVGGLRAGAAAVIAVIVAAGTFPCFASSAQAQTLPSSVAAFCAQLPAPRVNAILGTKDSLYEAVIVEKTAFECIYMGTEEVVISRHPGMPSSELATRAKAEATIAAASPKGVKFTSLPSLGPTAFSWTYDIHGAQLTGVGDNKVTTGYGVLLGGEPQFVGAPGRLSALERLLGLDMAA
jgi:hypothetical protein